MGEDGSKTMFELDTLRQLSRVGYDGLPAVIAAAGEKAGRRFFEFFTANIENRNTREAYARDVGQFLEWCDARGVTLASIDPMTVAAYVKVLQDAKEHGGCACSKPTTKRKLAAVRMMFDYLVTGGVIPFNPASSVRGPKFVIKKGKTPVLDQEQARQLLDSIDEKSVVGLRDRALIAVMIYSFARVSAVVAMNVGDYYQNGRRSWFRLHEKGGKHHEVPAHHKAEEYLDAYIAAAGIEGQPNAPLFRSAIGRTGKLTANRLHRLNALQMVKRRAKGLGLPRDIRCHTFRATGITAYLENGGTIEHAQAIAAHESPRTTKLYDRTNEQITLDEIERITI
jgi:integrase/recombinase XerD